MKTYKKPKVLVKGVTVQQVMQKKAGCSGSSSHIAIKF